MDIVFTPPLANQIRLTIAPVHSTAVLNFTAALSSAHHAQFIRDGAKLQIWSDVCLDIEKLHSTEWCAFDFQLETPASLILAGSTTAIELSLLTHEGNYAQHNSRLSVQPSVPISSPKCIFSFTYRIVYPAGEVKWLGQYGQNGIIVLEQSQSHSNFILHERWSMKNGGYAWTNSGNAVDNVEVAKLSNPSDYSIQFIGRGSYSDANKASLAFLVPRASESPPYILLEPTYILSASPGITFAVAHSGDITVSGVGSLLLQSPCSGPKFGVLSMVNNTIAHGPSDICEASTLGADTEHLLLTSQAGRDGRHPVRAVVLPLIPRQLTTASPIRIELNTLAAILPDEVTQYSIFSPLNLKIHFFTKPVERSGKGVYLLMDPLGGPFVLSPVFNLNDGRCQLSILSDYRSISLHGEFDPGSLPTPPPSPHHQPSSLPLSSRGTSSTPTSISSDPDTRLGLARLNSSEDGPPSRRQIQTPALRAILLAYITFLTTFVFMPLYQLFFGRIQEEINEWGTGSIDGKESRVTPGQEASSFESKNESQVMPVRSDVLTTTDDHEPGLVLPRPSPHSLLLETYEKSLRAAVRFTDIVAISTSLITVDLNGCTIDPTFTKLDDYISLLEADVRTGGLLKINCDIDQGN